MTNAIETGAAVMFMKSYTRGHDMESFRAGERGTVASMDGPETAMVRMRLDGFVYPIPVRVLAVIPATQYERGWSVGIYAAQDEQPFDRRFALSHGSPEDDFAAGYRDGYAHIACGRADSAAG